MTPDQIIQLAREAGGETDWQTKQSRSDPELSDHDFVFTRDDLTRFAQLIASHKQEQCAQICDAQGQEWDSDAVITEKNYAAHCAAAIRELED